MRRRNFLALAAVAGIAGIAGCGPGATRTGNLGTVAFTNRLRLPPLLEPSIDASGAKQFRLTMQTGHTEFLAGKPAQTLGFNGSYLGPTIRAARGDNVRLEVLNQIGADSTVHWHGMRTPAVMDGGPHQVIKPAATWAPHWTIDQPAATTWYHPHPHGDTALQVYRGLAGMFLLDDADSPTLELPKTYGVDDFPLIVQDKNIKADGTLSLAGQRTFGLLGNQILVNGTYGPWLEVGSTLVRLRILNAANARLFHIGFVDRRSFHVVGNDGGLLAAPEQVDLVSVSPGERVEIVVAFVPGESVVMRSFGGSDVIDAGDFDLLKIVAAGQLKPSPAIPGRLAATPPPEPPVGASVRRFRMGGDEINGKTFDITRIDEVVPAGAHEIWEIESSELTHDFHIHGVVFRVLDVAGQQPPAWYRWPKDTVLIPARSKVRLLVEFGHYIDPKSPYMYHCHLLRHEDHGMMGQFVIVEPGTEQQVPRTLAAADTSHTHG